MSLILFDDLPAEVQKTVREMQNIGIETRVSMPRVGEYCCRMDYALFNRVIADAPSCELAVTKAAEIVKMRWPDLFAGGD